MSQTALEAELNVEDIKLEPVVRKALLVYFQKKLEATKAAILAQTSSIDEVIRTVDHIQAQLRDKPRSVAYPKEVARELNR